jgi:hypothetical protein
MMVLSKNCETVEKTVKYLPGTSHFILFPLILTHVGERGVENSRR